MNHSGRRALHLLLSALVLLGGLPRFELRHRHEGGNAPHGHGRRDAHDPGTPHPSNTSPIGHVGHSHHAHAERPSAVAAIAAVDAGPREFASEDWHVHVTWLGGLSGLDWRPPGGDDGRLTDMAATALNVIMRDSTSATTWPAALALWMSLHGPPRWIAAPSPSAHLLGAGPDRGPSTYLCDRARHERTGVQLT